MQQDTNELEFRRIMNDCLIQLKIFEDKYYDSTDAWQNFITVSDQKDIMNGIQIIRNAFDHSIKQSIKRDLRSYE